MKKEKKYAMIAEIREQPERIEKLLDKHVKNNKILLGGRELGEKMAGIKRIILLGCGTSYHAAIFGNYVLEELARLNCETEQPHEFNSRKKVVEKGTMIIALSQSGKTTDLINAVRDAKKRGMPVLSITNKKNSALNKLSDISLYCEAGEEKAVEATKSFSTQILLLVLLALKIGSIKNNVSKEKTTELINELKKIPDKARAILEKENEIKKIAAKFHNFENMVLLGRKYNYPCALEGALKLKETTYIHAEGCASEEFIHGANAIIDNKFPFIFIMPQDSVYRENLRVYEKISKEKSPHIIITNVQNDLKADNLIFIPKSAEILTPLLSVVPLQILAYYIAIWKKIDLDHPRHISKYVEK